MQFRQNRDKEIHVEETDNSHSMSREIGIDHDLNDREQSGGDEDYEGGDEDNYQDEREEGRTERSSLLCEGGSATKVAL